MPEPRPHCTAPTVVIGVDERPAARTALEWALHHLPPDATVRPVITWTVPLAASPMPTPGMPPPPPPEAWEQSAVDRGGRGLAGLDDERIGALETCRGRRGATLAEVAAGTDAVVVGARATRMGAVLGTTGTRLTKAATVPVVIVPETVEPTTTVRTIVVGIDGSDHADGALRWVLDRAEPATRIIAVTAWQRPVVALDVAPAIDDALRESASRILDEAIDRLDDPVAADRLEGVVAEADPRVALTLGEPDMIVVGARGRRGIPHALLGSVATSLATAPVTVTVVVP